MAGEVKKLLFSEGVTVSSPTDLILGTAVDHRNLLINSAFDFWQRGSSFLSPGGIYISDRWIKDDTASSQANATQQVWNPADPGFDDSVGDNYIKIKSGNTNVGSLFLVQRIEGVKETANADITLAFRAKSATNEVLNISARQKFGSGGSATVSVAGASENLTNSWAVYNQSISLPSVAGKTIGAGNNLQIDLEILSDGTTNPEFDLDWVMVVKGSTAISEFRRAGANLQEENDMCLRYYEKSYTDGIAPGTSSLSGLRITNGLYNVANATSDLNDVIQFLVPKRVIPTVVIYSQQGTSGTVRLTNAGLGTISSAWPVVFGNVNTKSGSINVVDVPLNTATALYHYTADSEI